LTDEKFFQGSIHDLETVSKKVNIPVIRKDFIIHEKQIREALRFGASAILLIVRILKPTVLENLFQIAKNFGLEVLVETHNQKEFELAKEIGFEIIGINTRDLDNFEIHLDLIEKIGKQKSGDFILVGESGINSKQDYQNMKKYVDSVLIGTYFMKNENIESAYNSLIT
jgi:indole-3-glycerol phosphate synthase